MARAGLTFRDYGALLRLSGYDGSQYHLDVPALAALDGNVDLEYDKAPPSPSPRASAQPDVDGARAAEFKRDMQRYVDADRMPSFTYVRLPGAPGTAGAAAADKAVGAIVDYVSHTPHWSSTAIFIVPEGAAGSPDHVDAMRSYALVVSPSARRGYVGTRTSASQAWSRRKKRSSACRRSRSTTCWHRISPLSSPNPRRRRRTTRDEVPFRSVRVWSPPPPVRCARPCW